MVPSRESDDRQKKELPKSMILCRVPSNCSNYKWILAKIQFQAENTASLGVLPASAWVPLWVPLAEPEMDPALTLARHNDYEQLMVSQCLPTASAM